MAITSRKKQYKVTVGMQRSWWAKIATEPDADHPWRRWAPPVSAP